MKVTTLISLAAVALIHSQYVEFIFASTEVVGGRARGGRRGDYVSVTNGGRTSFHGRSTIIPKSNNIRNDNFIPELNSNNNINSDSNSNNYLKRYSGGGSVKIANGENQSVNNIALSYVEPNSDHVEVMNLKTVMKNSNRRKQHEQRGRRKRRIMKNRYNNQPKLLENGGEYDNPYVGMCDTTNDDIDNDNRRNHNKKSFLNNRATTRMLKSSFRHMNASLLTVIMITSFVALVKLTISLSVSNNSVATLLEEAEIMRKSLGMMSSNNNAFANMSYIEQFVKSRIGDTFKKTKLLLTKKIVAALFAFTTILYFVESALCSTRKYLSNVVPPQDFRKVINNIRHSEPVIKWHVECYHYRRWFSESNEVRKRLHEEKVITHKASKTFRYKKWKNTINLPKDYGPAAGNRNNKMNDGKNRNASGRSHSYSIAPYIRAKLLNCVTFKDVNALADYEDQLNEFLNLNGNRDYHMNHYTTMTVNGNLSKVLVVPTGIGTNRMAREHVFWLFTVLGLTVPYRIWFARYSGEANIMVTKEICTR